MKDHSFKEKYHLIKNDIITKFKEIYKYDELIKQLNSNEIRKLISEKVEELKKDVDAKISENGIEIEKNIQNIKEQYLPNNKKK